MKPAMQNLRLTLLVPLFCALIAPSCMKKDSPSASSCKIIGMRDNIGSTTTTASLTEKMSMHLLKLPFVKNKSNTK